MDRSLWDIIRSFFFRLFGYHHYDYQTVLEKYGFALSRPMTDLHRLSLMLPYLLLKAVHLNVASIMVLDPKTNQYHIHAADGDKCELDGQTVEGDNPLIQELTIHKKELLLTEAKNMAIAAEMKKLGAKLSIPAISESPKFPKPTLLFCVNLGKLLSGDEYTHEDIRFLRKFVGQIGVNLEQAFVG